MKGAEEDIIPSEDGEYYLKIVEAGDGAPHNHFLKLGQVSSIHNVLYALNKPTDGAINITYSENDLTIQSPYEGEYMTMATRFQGRLVENSNQPLQLRSLYNVAGLQFVFPDDIINGKFEIVKSKEEGVFNDGLFLKISTENESKVIGLLGAKGIVNDFKQIRVGKLDFLLKYGISSYIPSENKIK